MALTEKQKVEIAEYAKKYVEGFIKCNAPDSLFDVSGNTCDSVEAATDMSMERCSRPAVRPDDVSELDKELKSALKKAIESLDCP